MIAHQLINDNELRRKMRSGEIALAGNRLLKIYGTLGCTSGKRMKRINRVFFNSTTEALQWDYRPCGHCMRQQYNNWKNGFIQQS